MQYPRTRLHDLADFYKAKRAEFNLAHIRMEVGQDKQQVLKHYEKRIKKICDEYLPLFDFKDFHKFTRLGELESFLVNLNISTQREIKENIQHEKDHVIQLKKLGYKDILFGCFLALDDNQEMAYALSTMATLKYLMPKEHFKKISLAPEKPSLVDLC